MVNFTDFELLTASDLNAAFREKADLTTNAPQNFKGQINVPIIDAGIVINTVDLIATGSVKLTTTDSMVVPIGSTLQRPLATSFGMFRANSDTGSYEVVLGNGSWAQVNTQAAPTVAATKPSNLGGPTFGGATSNAIPVFWKLPVIGTPPYLFTLQYRAAGTTNWINWLTDVSDSQVSATVSGLLVSTRYEFQISARNTAGSTTSPVTSSSTLGFVPNGPANLIAHDTTSTTVALTWDAVPTNPIAYQVRYATPSETTWTIFATPTSDLAVTVYGLLPNQQYLFQVAAMNTAGSFESNTIQASTTGAATLPPNAATALVTSQATTSSVLLTWNAPTAGNGPFAYQVQYQISGASTWTSYKTPVTAPSLTVARLNSATTYFFRVMSINSAGSTFSQTVSAIIQSALPSLGGVAEFQATPNLPTISGPMLGSVVAGSALSNFGVQLDDPYAAYQLGSMIVSASCQFGSLTMTDNNFNPIQGSGTKAIANFATTLLGAQAILGSLTYTAPNNGVNDNITLTVTDQLTQQSSMLIAVSVRGSGGSPTPTPTPTPTPSPGGMRTPSGQPTDALGTTADQAFAITDSIGLVTRLELDRYNGGYTTVQAAVIENQINYIGNSGYITAVRQLCAGNMNASWLAQIAQNCGAFAYILAGDRVPFSLFGLVETEMVAFASTYPFCFGFEGFDPSGTTTGLNPAVAEQSNINALARSLGLSSFQLAPVNEADSSIIGEFAQHATFGSTRAFLSTCPGGPYGPVNDPFGGMHEKLARASTANPSSNPNAVVAFGYQTFADTGSPVAIPNWVAETVAAKYIIEGLIDAYQLGIEYIGIHELIDADQQFGLFRNDGTPKPAAQAVRAFFQLMGDPSFQASTFQPGNLNYTILGQIPNKLSVGGITYANTGLQQALFQKADGTFLLWLWNEQPLNDLVSNATVSVQSVSITIDFLETFMKSVSIYDPFSQNSLGGQPQPYIVYTSPTSVPVTLPPWPICLAIQHP